MEHVHILDHGYIAVVETWGSDERIIEAARMSTNKGFEGWGPKHADGCPADHNCDCDPAPGDEKLLKFLYDHKHDTPFEMAGMIVEVKAPIMVFREWHRHRTQSYNEMSARFTPIPNENYLPTVARCMLNPGKNKQAAKAQGAIDLTDAHAGRWLAKLEDIYSLVDQHYREGIDIGIPKELARLPMPVARYSRMRASANLRNWLAFMTLRSAPNAQWEIRQYSQTLGQLISEAFPRTWALFAAGQDKKGRLIEDIEQKAREQFCREQGNNPVDDAWYEGRAKGLRDAAEILKGRL